MEYKKRVLIVTQYFYPEGFKSNDMAFELAKRGYKVDVLAGIPNYPEGVYKQGYGVFKKRIESINGVNIYRAFQTPRGRKASGLGLMINYLSYVITSTLWVLFFFAWKKYDCVIVHEPSPITQACAAIILKKIKRIPFYIWIMDIWPDAMTSGGGIKNKFILNSVDKFVKWVYNNARKILITSKDFKELILREGNYEDKIVYFPNWSADMSEISDVQLPPLPTGYRIMMAGNLGSAQSIDCVMKATLLTSQNKDIKWIFVGDGSEKVYIDNFIRDNHLEDTVFALGRFPGNYMSSFYREADAMLITLRAKFPHLKAVVPARLQGYMSSGKPVIGMIDGGSVTLIRETDCGVTVPAEDYDALTNVILNDIYPNREQFALKGKNGRLAYEREFTINQCINNLEKIINNG